MYVYEFEINENIQQRARLGESNVSECFELKSDDTDTKYLSAACTAYTELRTSLDN